MGWKLLWFPWLMTLGKRSRKRERSIDSSQTLSIPSAMIISLRIPCPILACEEPCCSGFAYSSQRGPKGGFWEMTVLPHGHWPVVCLRGQCYLMLGHIYNKSWCHQYAEETLSQCLGRWDRLKTNKLKLCLFHAQWASNTKSIAGEEDHPSSCQFLSVCFQKNKGYKQVSFFFLLALSKDNYGSRKISEHSAVPGVSPIKIWPQPMSLRFILYLIWPLDHSQ